MEVPSKLALECAGVEAVTFDCYGTLIDWDAGIRAALGAIESLAGCDLDALHSEREVLEYALLEGPYRPYGELLGDSLCQAAAQQGRRVSPEERVAFVESMGHWGAFPDSAVALGDLTKRFRLAILSNVESAILRQSIAGFPVQFDTLVTAEGVRSYKPAAVHFEVALERLALGSEAVLHVAGSLYHDIRPALEAGWRVVWINRRGDPIPADLDRRWVFEDLASLTHALGLGARPGSA